MTKSVAKSILKSPSASQNTSDSQVDPADKPVGIVRVPPSVLPKGANYEIPGAFSFDGLQVWQKTVPNTYPYKEARLVDYDCNLSKRWHVEFWAWDISKNKLQRKRLFEPLNRLKTVNERIIEADRMVNIINSQLREGKVLGKDVDDFSVRNQIWKKTLLEAIDYVIEQKKQSNARHTYIRTLKRCRSAVVLWMATKNIDDFPLKSFNEDHVLSFFDFLQTDRKINNKTYNNYRNDLATIINFLMKRSPDVLKSNPVKVLDKLPEEVKKHAAFSDDQLAKIISEVEKRKKADQFLLMIQMIYYTLARPNELLNLRIGDIDLQNDRILFRAAISKNKRDEYVRISEQLKKLIEESGVMLHPKEYYIFGKNQMPGTSHPYGNAFWERNSNILKKLNFTDRNYSLYSYKHSGAISLYRATKDIKVVQRQCRHTTIAQTDQYLRDLHLMDDENPVRSWKGAF